MGVVNVTPNSFSDGGQFLAPDAAIAHGRELAAQGAAILDLGAEASSFFREGVTPVDAAEQQRRLLPVVHALTVTGALISIDTRSAAVAEETVRAGAVIVNDISAGTHDAQMLPTVAACGAGMVLMHIGPRYPAVVTDDDADIIHSVREYLRARIDAAESAGIERTRLAVDPGVGFGKSAADNWRLALRCHEFADLGVAILLGASRKRFLETSPPSDVQPPDWEERARQFRGEGHPRDAATAALTALAAERGVGIHRVHNVTLTRRALKM